MLPAVFELWPHVQTVESISAVEPHGSWGVYRVTASVMHLSLKIGGATVGLSVSLFSGTARKFSILSEQHAACFYKTSFTRDQNEFHATVKCRYKSKLRFHDDWLQVAAPSTFQRTYLRKLVACNLRVTRCGRHRERSIIARLSNRALRTSRPLTFRLIV